MIVAFVKGVTVPSLAVTSMLLFTFLFQSLAAAKDGSFESSVEASNANSVVCGPRCVGFVLREYGRDEDLTDLVREMQWPNLSGGATLGALARALEKRGVNTCAVSLDPREGFRWRYPVIVHLDRCGTSLGHYVVWMPSSSGSEAVVWDGINGLSTIAYQELASEMSGSVLLTSPSPIGGLDELSPAGQENGTMRAILVVGCLCVFLGIWCVYNRRNVRRNSVCTSNAVPFSRRYDHE